MEECFQTILFWGHVTRWLVFHCCCRCTPHNASGTYSHIELQDCEKSSGFVFWRCDNQLQRKKRKKNEGKKWKREKVSLLFTQGSLTGFLERNWLRLTGTLRWSLRFIQFRISLGRKTPFSTLYKRLIPNNPNHYVGQKQRWKLQYTFRCFW